MSKAAKPTGSFEAVIGLEIHVQLRTKSKMFCRCDNRADGAAPNSLTCPVCLALPGALPVPNQTAIEWALKAALALGCEIPKESKFDRKQYFYPDLPKGYQISQYDQPLGGPGTFEFDMPSGETRKIRITRLHLEEDAGKLTHPKGADYSLVDLNRAGTPLVEIVTEPDLRSPAEAKRFLQELRRLMRYLGVSDADMEKGHLRADANISMRPAGQQKLGVKTELKNLNSFRFVEKGLESEIKRQTDLLEKGEKIAQETRGFDEDRGKTTSQRGKEEAHDYRYFPEPDIPPLEPAALGLASLKKSLPELPRALESRLRKLNVPEEAVVVVTADKHEAEAFTDLINKAQGFEQIVSSRWLSLRKGDFFQGFPELTSFIADTVKDDRGKALTNIQLAALVTQKRETSKSVSDLLEDPMYEPVEAGDLESAINQAIKDNPQPVADFKSGNENAKQVIVGAVMKATKGAADAATVAQLVVKKLK